MSSRFALLTPPGSGAIATLALWGPDAWELARSEFQPRLPETPTSGVIRLGKIAGDQVVLATLQASPHVELEIHGHGGVEAVRLLRDRFRDRGALEESWRDWLRRRDARKYASLAFERLPFAPTVRTAAILLDQAQGALDRAFAEVESHISTGAVHEARSLLERLDDLAGVGRHLVEPFRVVVAGPPNAGKSSLVNALAGYTRVLVSPMPGTTRDVVATRIAIDGWPVELLDTAGLREGGEELEREGMTLARRAMRDAHLCLWIMDGSAACSPLLDRTALPVINKVDLPPAWDHTTVSGLHVSAQTGAGLTELCQSISTRLVPRPPFPGEAVPFTEDARAEVRRLGVAIQQATRER